MNAKKKILHTFSRLKPFVSFVFLLLLFTIAFSYAKFQGGFVSWFLFYSFLPFAVYSFLLFIYPVKFTVERRIPDRTFESGDEIEINLTVKRKLPFPLLFLMVEDELPDSLKRQEAKQMFFPGFKKVLTMTYAVKDIPRGEHVLHRVRLKTGDLFGMAEKEKSVYCRQRILVYPSPSPMIYQSFRSLFEQGGAVSGSKVQRDASLVAGVRKYVPGDRFSRIDWKATARSNDMMTKEFETRHSRDLLVILDLQPSKDFEVRVKFAASVIRTLLRNGEAAGLFSAGEQRVYLPPQAGFKQERALFYQLAKVQSDSSHPVEEYLGEEILRNHSAILLITGKLSMALIDRAFGAKQRKSLLAIYLIKDEGEFVSSEEAALMGAAGQRGLFVKTVYEHEFKTALAGVKEA